MHKNEQSIVTSPLAAPTPLSRVRRRVWTVQKEPAPLPLGLTDRHILTGEELSFHEMKSILDFAIDIPSSQRKTEEPEDTARVLAGYCHALMVRTYSQKILERMARVSRVPVINALSDEHHPCQALADLQTLLENFGELKGLKLAYVGDGNNVLNSLLLMAPVMGVEVRYACPKGYKPSKEIVFRAKERAKMYGGAVIECSSPEEAVRDSQAIYTDVWTSMGFEDENEARMKAFKGYKVDEALHQLADPDAVIMHCLPMLRDVEISGSIADSRHSVIFEQSENRLHAQKSLLVGLLAGG